jgi:hypothetical protein
MIKKALRFIFSAFAILGLLLLGFFLVFPYLVVDWVFDLSRPLTRDDFYMRL